MIDRQYKIPFVDLGQHYKLNENVYVNAFKKTIFSGQLIGGEAEQEFETRFSEYVGCSNAISVSNGTSALYLSLTALEVGIGDEVVVVANSYHASVSVVELVGATAVYADVDDSLCMSPESLLTCLTSRTKAVIVVHLCGNVADMPSIKKICSRAGIYLIEDCAQAIGSRLAEQHVGTFGHIGCFSFHPLKNLPAVGDGGVIITADSNLASWLRKARTHGHSSRDQIDFWSHNMRLDALKSRLLTVRLGHLDEILAVRLRNAQLYKKLLSVFPAIKFIKQRSDAEHSYHLFMIRVLDHRDNLINYMLNEGIEVKIHYPILTPDLDASFAKPDIPITRRFSNEILSLPINESLSSADVRFVSTVIESFFANKKL